MEYTQEQLREMDARIKAAASKMTRTTMLSLMNQKVLHVLDARHADIAMVEVEQELRSFLASLKSSTGGR